LAGRARNSCCSSSWRCMSCCVSTGLGASSLCCLSRCQFDSIVFFLLRRTMSRRVCRVCVCVCAVCAMCAVCRVG
jgi:hypothetical protein